MNVRIIKCILRNRKYKYYQYYICIETQSRHGSKLGGPWLGRSPSEVGRNHGRFGGPRSQCREVWHRIAQHFWRALVQSRQVIVVAFWQYETGPSWNIEGVNRIMDLYTCKFCNPCQIICIHINTRVHIIYSMYDTCIYIFIYMLIMQPAMSE